MDLKVTAVARIVIPSIQYRIKISGQKQDFLVLHYSLMFIRYYSKSMLAKLI